MITPKRIAVILLLVLAGSVPSYSQTAEQNAYSRRVRDGIAQMNNGDYRASKDLFEEALRYRDQGYEAHLGLGISYFHLRDDRSAERELNRAIEASPGQATAYQFLGELYYRRDDLESAIGKWEKAVELDPANTQLRARLDRIQKEHRTEKDFNREMTSHFLIKYEGREKIETGRIVLKILEEAYADVGRALSYYPDQDIQVILYSGQQFQDVTDAPGWSGGIFDGKIRAPIGGIEKETPGLRRILYHEYTHAVVHAITRRCPTWLNEGLAQYFDGGDVNARQRDLLRQAVHAGRIPPLANLEGSFMSLNGNQAASAYLMSLSAVRYMVDSFGMYRLRAVLDELRSGASTSEAVSRGISRSYEDLDRGWKSSLE